MNNFAQLEITLSRASNDAYAVELSSLLPGNDADVRTWGTAKFDLDQFRALSLETPKYASQLTDCLLQDPNVSTAFSNARVAAQVSNLPLLIRLIIEPSAQQLQALRWETLLDRQDSSYLFTGEQVIFSRYLSSNNWQPVSSGPALTALVVVANPAKLAKFNLPAVDVTGELTRARSAMSGINVSELASNGLASIKNLSASLHARPADILYLVCHGAFKDGKSWLWLDDQAGDEPCVPGSDLVACLKDLKQRPWLVVLASCEGAGAGNQDQAWALAALGPSLIAAGIPAVVAMQGSVSMETVAQFMPRFFGELLKSGQVETAMAIARGAAHNRPDFWMPVLFTRLRNGRILPIAEPSRTLEDPSPPRKVRSAAGHKGELIGMAIALLLFAFYLGYHRAQPPAHRASGVTTQDSKLVSPARTASLPTVTTNRPGHSSGETAPVGQTSNPSPAPAATPEAAPIQPLVSQVTTKSDPAKIQPLARASHTRSSENNLKRLPQKPLLKASINNSRDPKFILRNFKTVFIKTTNVPAMFFKSDQLKSALYENKGFASLNLLIVDSQTTADTVLSVGYTAPWDYPFELKHVESSIVLLSGKGEGPLSAIVGANSVADQFVKSLKTYRGAGQ